MSRVGQPVGRPGDPSDSFAPLTRDGTSHCGTPHIPGRGDHLWEFPGVTPATDAAPARWLVDALDSRWAQQHDVPPMVGSLVPAGYSAYARIFHPVPCAWTSTMAGTPQADVAVLRWSEIAAWSGQTLRADSNFAKLTVPVPGQAREPQTLRIGYLPYELPADLLEALVTVLRAHTTTPDHCWFALWEGYGDLGSPPRNYPARLSIPARTYLLYTGPVDGALAFATPGDSHAPTLWWPEDRSWFIGSDTDQDSTYVAGSPALIAELQHHPALEALPTSLDQRIDFGSLL